ncbi:hypothetical protein ACHAW6_010872 [Cyclotella cf. meneghiniana]
MSKKYCPETDKTDEGHMNQTCKNAHSRKPKPIPCEKPNSASLHEHMKNHIQDHYRFKMELVPPGSQRSNEAEVAIRNFKCHFLSILAGTSTNFPQAHGADYYHKQKSPSTFWNNQMLHQQYQPTPISADPLTTTKYHKHQ